MDENDKQLRKEKESARPHNKDSESMMGMFSVALAKAPNSTMSYLQGSGQ